MCKFESMIYSLCSRNLPPDLQKQFRIKSKLIIVATWKERNEAYKFINFINCQVYNILICLEVRSHVDPREYFGNH